MKYSFFNQCIVCENVECLVPCKTKWNKRQLRLVMAGKCNGVIVSDGRAYIS